MNLDLSGHMCTQLLYPILSLPALGVTVMSFQRLRLSRLEAHITTHGQFDKQAAAGSRIATCTSAADPLPDAVPEVTEVPPPENEVRLQAGVMVPMRDGVRLSTDIYYPMLPGAGTAALTLGVCLMRTPYDKKTSRAVTGESGEAGDRKRAWNLLPNA